MYQDLEKNYATFTIVSAGGVGVPGPGEVLLPGDMRPGSRQTETGPADTRVIPRNKIIRPSSLSSHKTL